MSDTETKRAKARTADRKWRLANPDKAHAAGRNWARENRDKRRDTTRRYTYGPGAPEHLAIQIAQQDGRCAICQYVFTVEPHLDHKHATHQLRGALCRGCNLLISDEDATLLESAARYLRYWDEIGSIGSQPEALV
jgi:5-methylcytosine-specific restriction endonuclease McrA